MENAKKRITVTIPAEKEAEIHALKKEKFEGKSSSEFIRHLIKKGLECADSKYL